MKKWWYVAAGFIVALFCTQIAYASSEMEILLKKLQEKGILSAKEAQEIATETKQAAEAEKVAAKTESKEAKLELPEFLKNTKFKGDFRLRYELGEKHDDGKTPRDRARFRLRMGAETQVADDVTVGFGLSTGSTSSDTTSAPWIKKPNGDPRSGNQTFQDSFSRKSIYIDYAYARYTPTKWLTLLGGKFANPIWQPSDMLISTEMNLEGAGVKLEAPVAKNFNLFFNGGYFFLDENSNDHANPNMYVLQAGLKWNMTKDLFLRIAPAYYRFNSIQNHLALNWSAGSNTYISDDDAETSKYQYDYNSWHVGAELGYDKPFGLSAIPYASIFGGWIHNPDPHRNNNGYLAGLYLGAKDVKQFADWSVEYTFRRIETDAWLDIFPDSSFYSGKTNAMGHRVKVLFGLTKNTSFGLNYYNTWKITGNSAEENLVQGDLLFRF